MINSELSFHDAELNLVNEVRECNSETTFLNGFKLGFIDGANQQG